LRTISAEIAGLVEGKESTEVEVETERFAEYKDLAGLGELADECV
jgi:hypothetical protein